MKTAEQYNSNLRAEILIFSITAEEIASEILLKMLRLVKPDSKTLGNKGSSLSFKNKIDLLSDIEDLSDDMHKKLVKFMEIRNQFIHNPKCNSFIALAEQNSVCTNFLKKNFGNDIKDREKSLYDSFTKLYADVVKALATLSAEYHHGIHEEAKRYEEAVVFEKIDEIFQSSIDEALANEKFILAFKPHGYSNESTKSYLDTVFRGFKMGFDLAILEQKMKFHLSVGKNEITAKDVFSRRLEISKIIQKMQDESLENNASLADKGE